MKSKTKIEKQLKKKTNSELVETIIAAKKKDKWLEVAGLLSSSRKNQANLNLSEINKQAKEGEVVIVPGKVLSQGEIDKKVTIAALNFSEKAKEKLIKAGSKVLSIVEEIKSNPEAKGLHILKGKGK
jgi:large subunit ribosomal protein L18e